MRTLVVVPTYEEAGIKGVTFKVEGEYAYGLLAAEAGVHLGQRVDRRLPA